MDFKKFFSKNKKPDATKEFSNTITDNIKDVPVFLKSKNDFIEEFRQKLKDENIPYNTIKNYIIEFKKALYGQEFSTASDIDSEKIENHIKKIRGKKSATNLKVALKKFKEINNNFKYDDYTIDIEASRKSHKRLTKFKDPFNVSTTIHKVNSMENERLKLAYKLMLNGALRVDEASNLRKENFTFTDEGVFVHVEHGKTDIPRDVKLLESSHLENSLSEYLKYFYTGENIFYSKSYMQKNAKKLNFQCHDLRRASSQIVLGMYDSNNKEEAVEAVKKHLGHSPKTRTYKKYLSRKINFDNTKWKK